MEHGKSIEYYALGFDRDSKLQRLGSSHPIEEKVSTEISKIGFQKLYQRSSRSHKNYPDIDDERTLFFLSQEGSIVLEVMHHIAENPEFRPNPNPTLLTHTFIFLGSYKPTPLIEEMLDEIYKGYDMERKFP